MKDVVVYTVVPRLPERLKPLEAMAKNLWFCWNLEVIDLFRSIDPGLWEDTGHNPLAMISALGNERIKELLEDDGFLLEMDRIASEFVRYVGEKKTYAFGLENPVDFTIAYFSAEYGLTDCLPIYSGGLGILSGDHLKSASDLSIPMVGIGLLYQKGYFRQYLNVDGWQQETYPENDFHVLPVVLERDERGEPLTVEAPIAGRSVKVRIWRIQVGKIPLFMLDTNTVLNAEGDRDITSYLYGGDREMRLKQEIVLGIGGVRALSRMGIRPAVYHLNEGHCSFALVERIRLLMEEQNLPFEAAREAVSCSSVFTTHTPVPAGIDMFEQGQIASIFGDYVRSLGISVERFLSLGVQKDQENGDPFNMAVLAIKNAGRTNGVSDLHRSVSRRMWKRLWPDLPEWDIPIEGITNGIHIPSWISNDMATLLDRYLGRRWTEDPDNAKVWERINRIPDVELWRTHERRRERLVAFTRRRLQEQLGRWGAKKIEIQAAGEALNPQALTIGFARRFATYKRGDLILRDPGRLSSILNNPQHPVQIIFAGKAHPQDQSGKEVIKNINHLARLPEFSQRIAFIEDYDLAVARYLVQGSDIWLNNPLRPLEACGTSGMKAAANGALNMSVLDGWWAEGYQPGLGWAIGGGEEYENMEYQDRIESQTIYNLLEKTIVPLFYERGRDNLPREWIGMMKRSMQTLAARFNTHRMLQDYVHRCYVPSANGWNRIRSERFNGARDLASWTGRMNANWRDLKVLDVRTENRAGVEAGGTLQVTVDMHLGSLTPADVSVDIYYGPINSKADFINRFTLRLHEASRTGASTVFQGRIPCPEVGRFGFRVRVLPSHHLLTNPFSLGLILWA
jgi:glycogen phosphorylase